MRPLQRPGPLVALLGTLVFGVVRAAEPPELVTDRPDQTESSAVVPPSSLQLEAGLTVESSGGAAGERRTELPGLLLRYGWTERLELRVAAASLRERVDEPGGRVTRSGFADPEVGAKLALRSGAGISPALAILAHLALPVGTEELSSERVDPALRLIGSHELSPNWGLGWNAGIEWTTEPAAGDGRTTRSRWIWTAALGRALSPRWGLFCEAFGDVPGSDPQRASTSIDAGVTRSLGPRLQLDLAVGAGIAGAAPDRFATLGFSARFDR